MYKYISLWPVPKQGWQYAIQKKGLKKEGFSGQPEYFLRLLLIFLVVLTKLSPFYTYLFGYTNELYVCFTLNSYESVKAQNFCSNKEMGGSILCPEKCEFSKYFGNFWYIQCIVQWMHAWIIICTPPPAFLSSKVKPK